MTQTNPFSCDCGNYTFPVDTTAQDRRQYGRKQCPECRSAWTVTRIGLQAKRTGITVSRQAKRDYTEAERLYAVMLPDGSITCTGCGHVTELLTGRDGTLAGKRGVYCALCLATKSVRVIGDTERKMRDGSIKIVPLSWNNQIQRIEAESGILQIARSIGSGDPLNYGNMLAGSNWSGLRLRSNPAQKLQNGDPNPDYHNMVIRTPDLVQVSKIGYFAIACASPWFAASTIHPDRCACLDCARQSTATRRKVIRLPRLPLTVTYNGQVLATVTPKRDGIGRQATATASAILGTPERTPINVTRCEHFERTLPRASAPSPDPAMHLPCDTAIARIFRRSLATACARTL